MLCPWMWVVVRCKQYKMWCRLVTQAAPRSCSPDCSHASMLCKPMSRRVTSCGAEPDMQQITAALRHTNACTITHASSVWKAPNTQMVTRQGWEEESHRGC